MKKSITYSLNGLKLYFLHSDKLHHLSLAREEKWPLKAMLRLENHQVHLIL